VGNTILSHPWLFGVGRVKSNSQDPNTNQSPNINI